MKRRANRETSCCKRQKSEHSSAQLVNTVSALDLLADETVTNILEQLLGQPLLCFNVFNFSKESWTREQTLLAVSGCSKRLYNLAFDVYKRLVVTPIVKGYQADFIRILNLTDSIGTLHKVCNFIRYMNYNRLSAYYNNCMVDTYRVYAALQGLPRYCCRKIFHSIANINSDMVFGWSLEQGINASIAFALFSMYGVMQCKPVCRTDENYERRAIELVKHIINMKEVILSDIKLVANISSLTLGGMLILASQAAARNHLQLVEDLLLKYDRIFNTTNSLTYSSTETDKLLFYVASDSDEALSDRILRLLQGKGIRTHGKNVRMNGVQLGFVHYITAFRKLQSMGFMCKPSAT